MGNSIFKEIELADPDGMAIEALMQVELEVLTSNNLPEIEADNIGFTQMAFKDDYGYWKVTGITKNYLSYEDLLKDFPDIS